MSAGFGTGGDDSAGASRKFGLILVGVGLCLCGWTFMQVWALLGGGDVGLIERLIPLSRASRSILIEGQNVEMPASFFEYGAYGMAIGLLSVVATMANAMMRAGAALHRPGFGRFGARLKNELAAEVRSGGN